MLTLGFAPDRTRNSTGRGEGIRGGARAITIPDVIMGVLRILSTWINRMEGSSFMAIAPFWGAIAACARLRSKTLLQSLSQTSLARDFAKVSVV